jgi:hypothetical protein
MTDVLRRLTVQLVIVASSDEYPFLSSDFKTPGAEPGGDPLSNACGTYATPNPGNSGSIWFPFPSGKGSGVRSATCCHRNSTSPAPIIGSRARSPRRGASQRKEIPNRKPSGAAIAVAGGSPRSDPPASPPALFLPASAMKNNVGRASAPANSRAILPAPPLSVSFPRVAAARGIPDQPSLRSTIRKTQRRHHDDSSASWQWPAPLSPRLPAIHVPIIRASFDSGCWAAFRQVEVLHRNGIVLGDS